MGSTTELEAGEASEPNREIGRLLAAAWLGCLGWWLSVYVFTLDNQDWLATELSTLKAGRLSFTAMLADRATFGHCPIYFSLSWAIQRLAGENIIALRLPSLIFGLLCAVMVYRLVRRWAGSGAAAFSTFLLLGLVATDIMVSPQFDRSRNRALLFGLVSLLGLLTSHSYWLVLLAHGAVYALNAHRRRVMIGAGAAAALGAVPWLLFAKYWAESGGATERFLMWIGPVEIGRSLTLPGRLTGMVHIDAFAWSPLPLTIVTITISLALAGITRLPRPPRITDEDALRPTLAALWLIPPLVALAAGLLSQRNLLLLPRYFTVTATVQMMLIAWAVWSARVKIRWIAALVIGICLAGQSLVYVGEISRDEIRRSTRIVEAEIAQGEAVIIIDKRHNVRLFKQHFNSVVVGCFIDTPPYDQPLESNRRFPEYRGRKRGAWVLIPHSAEHAAAFNRKIWFQVSAYLPELRSRYQREEAREIGDYVLYHFWDRARYGGGDTATHDPAGTVID